MSKSNKTNEKAAVIMAKTMSFLKQNVYYILMGVCIVALACVIIIAAVNNANKENPSQPNSETPIGAKVDENKDNENVNNEKTPSENKPEEKENKEESKQTIAEKFYIISPVDEVAIQNEFSNTELVYNSTQKHWATHEGVDFTTKEGSEVKCVYDGVVKQVQNSSFYGTSVVVEHKDGYESVYKLLEGVIVKEGDKILKNQKIGIVSKDALAEINDGPHLHFELRKDGKNIDPMEYLTTGDK